MFTKSDRFQLPAGADMAAARKFCSEFPWKASLPLFFPSPMSASYHGTFADMRYRVTACVLPYVIGLRTRTASSIDFNQRGSVAKAGPCSNYRLSVRPSGSNPIQARTYVQPVVRLSKPRCKYSH